MMSPEETDDCSTGILVEYEDQFQVIDSKLEDIRSSFVEVSEDDCLPQDDEEQMEEATTSSLLYQSSLKAALAEESAKEMKRIVQTLKEQQERTSSEDPVHVPVYKKEEMIPQVIEFSTTTRTSTKGNTPPLDSPNASSTGRCVLFSLLPSLLFSAVAWQNKSLYLSPSNSTAAENITLVEQLEEPTIQTYRYRKQIFHCHIVNGKHHCQSEEEKTTTSSSNDGNGAQYHSHERQQCEYINGQSYCESEGYDQSANTIGTSPTAASY